MQVTGPGQNGITWLQTGEKGLGHKTQYRLTKPQRCMVQSLNGLFAERFVRGSGQSA